MPSDSNALSPSETMALVHFLLTLHGPNLTPAVDASRTLTSLRKATLGRQEMTFTILVILSGWVYLRGWFAIRKAWAAQFSLLRLNCFLLGLVVLWIALAAPLDDWRTRRSARTWCSTCFSCLLFRPCCCWVGRLFHFCEDYRRAY